jgi:hypothetical protein
MVNGEEGPDELRAKGLDLVVVTGQVGETHHC